MRELNELETNRWNKFQAICQVSNRLLLDKQIQKYAHLDYATRTLWEERTSNWSHAYWEREEDAHPRLVFYSGSGIGTAVEAYHSGLGIKCDITDYGTW